jgi:protein N-terminal amidase
MEKSERLKISAVSIQIDGVRGQVEANFEAKVLPQLKKHEGKPIDIVVLPECALSGYSFKSKEEVMPISEVCGKGPQFRACKTVATTLNAYTVMGYIERGEGAEEGHLFNSCYVLDRSGSILQNYRKILMYETDKKYFTEGSERKVLELTTLGNQKFTAMVGICMDINYKDFIEFFEFPMAEFGRDNKVDCVIFPTAWILQQEDLQEHPGPKLNMELYEWWAMRMTPMIDSKLLRLRKQVSPRMSKQWLFIAADRVGSEDDTSYKGCSTILVFNKPSKMSNYFTIQTMLNYSSVDSIYAEALLDR